MFTFFNLKTILVLIFVLFLVYRKNCGLEISGAHV